MKRIVLCSLVLGLLTILASGVAPVWAGENLCGGTPCDCGDTVTTSGRLIFPDDPVVVAPCNGNGLTVQSGVDLDLNTNTITGNKNIGVGLLLQGSSGTVINGRVRNFGVGIKSDGFIAFWQIGPDVTSSLSLSITGNRTGIDLIARNTIITRSAITGNRGDGIVMRGSANSINRITCSSNGGRGLSLEGNTNFLESNRCEKNGGHGFSVDGDDNILIRNLGGGNGGTGVLAVGDGNVFEKNQGRTNNGDGVRGIGTNLSTDHDNYGTGNGGPNNCRIDGSTPAGGGRYC